MMNLTYKEEGNDTLQHVTTLTYAVIHKTDGIYLYYTPEGVTCLSESFQDVIIKLDVEQHYLSAKTIK